MLLRRLRGSPSISRFFQPDEQFIDYLRVGSLFDPRPIQLPDCGFRGIWGRESKCNWAARVVRHDFRLVEYPPGRIILSAERRSGVEPRIQHSLHQVVQSSLPLSKTLGWQVIMASRAYMEPLSRHTMRKGGETMNWLYAAKRRAHQTGR